MSLVSSVVRDILSDDFWQTYTVTSLDTPNVRFFEKVGDEYKLYIPMPGAKREQIEVTVADNRVTVKCNDKDARFVKEKALMISLPKNADAETLTSSYVDGVVTVTCKPGEAVRSRKVALS